MAPQPAGQSQTFTVPAADASGAVVPNLPVILTITGVNPQQLSGTTDAAGHATFTNFETVSGQQPFFVQYFPAMTFNPRPGIVTGNPNYQVLAIQSKQTAVMLDSYETQVFHSDCHALRGGSSSLGPNCHWDNCGFRDR